MKNYRKAFIPLLAAACLTAGCNILPEPGSLIQAPKPAAAEAGEENLILTAKKFLPKGTALVVPESPVQAAPFLTVDMDADGQDEIITFYQSKQDRGPVGMFILKKNGANWEKVYAKKVSGYEVSWAGAADFTGDGQDEIAVGWKFGSSAGNTLELFTWKDDELEQLAKVNYHELSVVQFEDDPKARLAVWKKEGNDIYNVDVLEWKGGALYADKTHYPSYFPEAADYYKRRTAAVPEASYYRYYLADALLKANLPDQALAELDQGMAYNMVVPNYEQFLELHEKIERAIEAAGTSDRVIELRTAGITMEVPAAIASAITAEEEETDSFSYRAGIYAADEAEKKKLFTIEIHAQDFYGLEDMTGWEKIAETDQFVYFVKKAEKVKGGAAYEKSYALADKMIANIRPGTVYPGYADAENDLIVQQVKAAQEKYAYAVRGGEIPEGPIDLFTKNGIEYRYMGSDLDTKEKLVEYLGES